MKQIDRTLQKGDRVWVRMLDFWGDPTYYLRRAEVIASQPPSVCTRPSVYITLKYLDDGIQQYECVSLERVEGFCEEADNFPIY